MNKLIIVCGLSGSGKTTVAEVLSKELGFVCLHKDTLKENLYDILELSTLEESRWIGKRSMMLLWKIAEEQIARGIDIILEAPFNFSEDYSLFRLWQTKYQTNIFSVICSVDMTIRERRFRSRERHRAHHDPERLLSQETFDYADIPGKHILLDTTKPLDTLVQYVVQTIRKETR